MEFEINPQRLAYLNARGKIVLNACPGSGKTTAVARKLMLLQDEYKTTLSRFSGIACLSFTNTAKNEISEKYTELSGDYLNFPHKVSTIDSFINQYITLPFYYLYVKNAKRPKILDDPNFLNEAWLAKWRYRGKNKKPICFAYPPASIRFESDGNFSSNGYRPSEDKVSSNVFDNYCAELKQWQIQTGLITTSDSAYIAYSLLCNQPKIGHWLALRFPYIIVDEAQDNSAVQHALFDKLTELGLANLEFIGDPYQSLYEWRDADPDLFNTKYADTQNWQGLDLTDNRRSPQRIIDCFSILRKQGDPAINTACSTDLELPVMVYRYNETNSPLIVQHFDQQCVENGLEDNQIVVRGNALKNQMLGKSADQVPWKSDLPYRIIDAKHKYEGNEIKAAIKAIRSIAVSLIAQKKEMVDIKELEQELKTDNQFNALLLNLLHDLPSFDQAISDWTTSTQTFLNERLELTEHVSFEQKKRSYRGIFDKAILNEPLKEHFKRSYSENRIPITTVHQVKGKSLDSILVFFNEKKHKDNITFSDIESSGLDFPSEKQRIIYVALSRPKHLLAMAFPDSISENELKAKLGESVQIITNEELEN
ncbi:UvrD-helicase domain-containing protein [Flagellimonas sp.]|uniref:UvrD-helicase domain-containing protein n=1 Tax=Flagellimonas sp. TaxID=2058762 RepID=UPI003BAFBC02